MLYNGWPFSCLSFVNVFSIGRSIRLFDIHVPIWSHSYDTQGYNAGQCGGGGWASGRFNLVFITDLERPPVCAK